MGKKNRRRRRERYERMMMTTTTSQSGDDLRRPIINSGPKFLSRLRHYSFADLDVQSER
jgi:hypothetical protein